MACAFAGLPQERSWGRNHPADPDDFCRCLLLLEAVPEAREHLEKVAKISRVWENIVDNFEKLETMFLDEVGLNWCKATSAPKTYEFMKSLGC